MLYFPVILPADRLLRGGVGFGTPVHAVKSLQIALSGYNPGESASEEGFVEGYGLPFNIKPPTNSRVRKPHPVIGKTAGLYLSSDGPHETNHGAQCKALFDGIRTCDELAGVNLNAHEQNHAKKKKYSSSLNVMGSDSFAFTVTNVNEGENQAINRTTVDGLVGKIPGHSRSMSCKINVWACGRCFCRTPLMRSFDRFGRVAVTFLSEDLVL